MTRQTEERNPLIIEELSLKKSALIIRAINHKLRQQIIRLIYSKERMTVTEIYEELKLEQSVTSQHLAVLRKAGYVKTTREGKFIYYSVNVEKLEQLQLIISSLLK